MAEVIHSSFIPKREFAKKKTTKKSFSINIFFLIGLIIFLSSVVGSIWVYMWKAKLVADNEAVQLEFAKKADQYGIETIKEFSTIASRIEHSKELLEKHYNILPIFTFLENNTLADIYYTDLTITDKTSESGGGFIVVHGSGVASDLPDLSLQADAYGENPNIDNLVISNITRSRQGFVIFDLDFNVKKKFLTTQSFLAQ